MVTHTIQRYQMVLQALPLADYLESPNSGNLTCLMTDDGTATTCQLAQRLKSAGWQVVVLSFPHLLVNTTVLLSSEIEQINCQECSDTYLGKQLDNVLKKYPKIGAFIHLHPVRLAQEKTMLKGIFFLAKYLQKSLNQTLSQGRNCFFTVTRLDGEFGSGKKGEFSPLAGGVFGLTKTLNLEWKDVFCRAMDISPEFSPEQTAEVIFNELHDPNALIVDVSYNCQGRFTLTCEPAPLTELAFV